MVLDGSSTMWESPGSVLGRREGFNVLGEGGGLGEGVQKDDLTN